MLEALCRQSSTTLDIMHAEDGPPITQRTSGLEHVYVQLSLPAADDLLAQLTRAVAEMAQDRSAS
jgi:hypothetical protein